MRSGLALDQRLTAFEANMTKLEAFLKRKRIKPLHLARESRYSRPWLLKIRMGRVRPTVRCVEAIVNACSKLSGETVTAGDLFGRETLHDISTSGER